MRRAWPAALLVASLAGCRDEAAPLPRDPGRREPPPTVDAAVAEPPPCVVPAPVVSEQVLAGYFPAVPVEVRSVVDGDTARFVFADGARSVRFLFVDTEESRGARKTDFGASTESRVRGEIEAARRVEVAVRRSGRDPALPDLDPYDRWLGLVYVDGVLYQTHLVREGLSVYYTKYGCAPASVHEALLAAEAEAHAAGRGVWAPGHPTDYHPLLERWLARKPCRRNPFDQPACSAD